MAYFAVILWFQIFAVNFVAQFVVFCFPFSHFSLCRIVTTNRSSYDSNQNKVRKRIWFEPS